MSSLTGRFRAWLASAEFAVTATAVVFALVAGAVVFETGPPDSMNGYFVVFLAGIGVPSIYEQSWEGEFDSRPRAVAWSLVASVAVVASYLALATGLRAVASDTAASIAAFVATWLAGIVAARAVGGLPE